MAKMSRAQRRAAAAEVKQDDNDEITEDETSNVKDISNATYMHWNPDTKIMKARYNVRKSQGGQKYTKVTEFDFSDCSMEDIMHLAMYDVRVKAQAKMRDMTEELMADPKTFAKCNVKNDLLNSTRIKMTEEEKFVRQAMKLGITREMATELLHKNLETKEVAA